MPPDPPRNGVLRTQLAYPQVIIFIALAFSGPPSIFLPCYAHALMPVKLQIFPYTCLFTFLKTLA